MPHWKFMSQTALVAACYDPAAEWFNLDTVSFLIERSAAASAEGEGLSVAEARCLLVNQGGDEGMTPLLAALQSTSHASASSGNCGNQELATLLLRCGARFNETRHMHMQLSPLSFTHDLTALQIAKLEHPAIVHVDM